MFYWPSENGEGGRAKNSGVSFQVRRQLSALGSSKLEYLSNYSSDLQPQYINQMSTLFPSPHVYNMFILTGMPVDHEKIP